uniref:Uncharacterized protein n=1 Tax=Anguilla anguilla TaxID=7936 RepID=A0A0E9QMY6_ANGAN
MKDKKCTNFKYLRCFHYMVIICSPLPEDYMYYVL